MRATGASGLPLDALVEPVGERPQQPLERRDVGPDPPGAVGDPGPGGAGERAQAGGLGDQLLGLGGELGEVGRERGVVVRLGERLAAGDADGDALGERPVDGDRSPDELPA